LFLECEKLENVGRYLMFFFGWKKNFEYIEEAVGTFKKGQ